MDVIGMSEEEQVAFINTLKARHNSFHDTCPLSPTTENPATEDCLSTAMIFTYLDEQYEGLNDLHGTEVTEALTALKSGLTCHSGHRCYRRIRVLPMLSPSTVPST